MDSWFWCYCWNSWREIPWTLSRFSCSIFLSVWHHPLFLYFQSFFLLCFYVFNFKLSLLLVNFFSFYVQFFFCSLFPFSLGRVWGRQLDPLLQTLLSNYEALKHAGTPTNTRTLISILASSKKKKKKRTLIIIWENRIIGNWNVKTCVAQDTSSI